MNQSRVGTTEENADKFVCNGLVRIQPKWWDCTSIETREWLKAILGEPNQAYQEWLEEKIIVDGISSYAEPYWVQEHEPHILEWLEATTKTEYAAVGHADNSYNSEQDLYDQIIYQVFVPKGEEHGDWYYSDNVYVAVQIHRGGDVRGNYTGTRLYGPVDVLAEIGFLDWTIGWYVQYLDGESADENGRFGIGYASNPTCELADHLTKYSTGGRYPQPDRKEPVVVWSEKHQCFLSRMNGRTVKLFPEVRAGY